MHPSNSQNNHSGNSLKLSFIVPFYNAANYLEECIDSLLSQDIPQECYEIICVNDGSTDNSNIIVQRFSLVNPNVVVVNSEDVYGGGGHGVSNARNIGIRYSNGQYVWFVDADDFIQNNILHALCSFIEENLFPDVIQIGAYAFGQTLTPSERSAYLDNSETKIAHSNNTFVTRNVFKSSFVKGKISFAPELFLGEDIQFMNDIYVHNPDQVLYNKPLYYYRQNSDSVTFKIRKALKPGIFEGYIQLFHNGIASYEQSTERYQNILARNINIIVISALMELSSLKHQYFILYFKEMKYAGFFKYRPYIRCTSRLESIRLSDILCYIRMRIYRYPYFFLYRMLKLVKGSTKSFE